ncbi:hypothetical protein [Salinisphaera sp. T31B1]|uniref:chorismate transformation enzyme, FkbO/Hyg5 family n=1 Tax=Salinisphaera sp. T31B1 TaxID=727963 RepID=UPI00333F11F0
MPDVSTGQPAVRWHSDAAPAASSLLASVPHDPRDDWFACPLEWIEGDFRGEAWSLELDAAEIESGQAHGWRYRRCGSIALATCHIDDGPDPDPEAIQQAAYDGYRALFALQADLGLSELQRIWHWLSSVTEGDGDDERYQRFCRGRAEALDTPGHPVRVLPPATLVSGARRGVRMHALIGDRAVQPIENPRQVSAYRYPRDYGLRAPAFARGGVATLGSSRYLLISGTASIIGHESRHPGDVDAQADEAMNNLAAVIKAAAPQIGAHALTDLECIKAYVRDPADAPAVRARLSARLPGVPAALLHAPLCREELLVEFEAQMPV